MIVVGLTTEAQGVRPPQAPQPPAAAAPVWTSPAATPTPSTSSPPERVGMTRSEPVQVTIPRIGVAAKIMKLGVNADGTLQTPPLEKAELAGWYGLGPSPGEVGNAVVVGHVDSRVMGPAVFFNIGSLRSGDIIEIKRKDASVARFVVNGVASYPKSAFPSDLVYGSSNQAELRLVTCGGVFDRKARSYLNNIVVFATLEAPHVATLAPAPRATATKAAPHRPATKRPAKKPAKKKATPRSTASAR